MATVKQKVVGRNKEIEKRLAAVEVVRAARRKIAPRHKTFPEINSLIREIRKGTTATWSNAKFTSKVIPICPPGSTLLAPSAVLPSK